MLITQFLTVTVITILAVVSPGPDFAVVAHNSLNYSRRAGFFTAVGIALGLTVHVTYSLVGIGFLIARSILLFNIIKYIGAAYLIYVGILSLRARKHAQRLKLKSESRRPISDVKALRVGFLTNALNPKATLFFLALFTQVLSATTTLPIKLFFGVEIMLIAFAWFSLLSYLLTVDEVRKAIGKLQHHVERLMGVILIALGIKVAFFTAN